MVRGLGGQMVRWSDGQMVGSGRVEDNEDNEYNDIVSCKACLIIYYLLASRERGASSMFYYWNFLIPVSHPSAKSVLVRVS